MIKLKSLGRKGRERIGASAEKWTSQEDVMSLATSDLILNKLSELRPKGGITPWADLYIIRRPFGAQEEISG